MVTNKIPSDSFKEAQVEVMSLVFLSAKKLTDSFDAVATSQITGLPCRVVEALGDLEAEDILTCIGRAVRQGAGHWRLGPLTAQETESLVTDLKRGRPARPKPASPQELIERVLNQTSIFQ